MLLTFTKMHGLGNDFVVIDGVRQQVALTPDQIRHLADRRRGMGCDQILLAERPQSGDVDFRYRIFNADGGEVEQCGNGAHCFARFVVKNGLTTKTRIPVETAGGNSLRRAHAGRALCVAGRRPYGAFWKPPANTATRRPCRKSSRRGNARLW